MVIRVNELCVLVRVNELYVVVRVNELYVVVRVNEVYVNELCIAVRVNEQCVVVRVNELCMVASEMRHPHVSFVRSSRLYAFASFSPCRVTSLHLVNCLSFSVFFFQFSGEDILC